MMKICKNCLREIDNPKLNDFEDWKRRVDEAKNWKIPPIGAKEIARGMYCQIMDGEYLPQDLCNYCYSLLRTYMQIEKLTFMPNNGGL